jgi:uncharacterized protein YuzE
VTAQCETHWEYDAESDVLDVYFGEKRREWSIELTDNIVITIDRAREAVVGLSFLDYSVLLEPTPLGPRSFPVTGLADLPIVERDLVLKLITSEPVIFWLDVSAVHQLPDSPFTVAHVQRPPEEVSRLLSRPASA